MYDRLLNTPPQGAPLHLEMKSPAIEPPLPIEK